MAEDSSNSQEVTPPPPIVAGIAPILSAITGGSQDNSQAIADAAKGAGQDVISKLAATIQTSLTSLNAAFNAGRASTSSPNSIAQTTQSLAETKSQAIVDAGNANANVSLMDNLAASAKAVLDNKTIAQLHMTPGSPEVVAANQNIAANADEINQQLSHIRDMKSNGFFDNPGKWLVDHAVNIPWASSAASGRLADLKTGVDALSEQSKALGIRTAVDALVSNPATVDRAVEAYKAASAQALALGIDPLQQAQQIKISGYNLGVEQGKLNIEQQKLPGQLALQAKSIEYYDAAKNESLAKTQAQTDLYNQQVADRLLKNSQDADSLKLLNATLIKLGGAGDITTVKNMDPGKLHALTTIAVNMYSYNDMIADNPADAFRLITNAGIPTGNLPTGQRLLFQRLGQTYRQAEAMVDKDIAQNPMTMGKITPKDREDRVTGAMNQLFNNEANGGWSATNKFYTLPSVAETLKLPNADSNPILQALRPMTVDGAGGPTNRNLDGSLLMNTAAQLVLDKKITEADAFKYMKDISFNITNANNQGGGWKRYAIPVPDTFNLHYNSSGFSITDPGTSVNVRDSVDFLKKLRLQVNGIQTREVVGNAKEPGL